MSIRLASLQDIPQILDIYAPYILHTAVSFEETVPAISAFTRRFTEISKQFPFLVWEENGEILGYAYASAPFTRAAYRWCAEPSVYLAPRAQGRGIGTALYEKLEEYLRRQGYCVSYAIVTAENEPSLRFHRKCGYEILARFDNCGYKLGAWHGIVWLEKRLQPDIDPASPPIPFPQIVENI